MKVTTPAGAVNAGSGFHKTFFQEGRPRWSTLLFFCYRRLIICQEGTKKGKLMAVRQNYCIFALVIRRNFC